MLKDQAIGRLSREASLRFTRNGKAVSNFTLICKVGEDEQGNIITSSIDCVVRNKTAETLANYTTRGSIISVDGDIKISKYKNIEGQPIHKMELSVNKFAFLETKEITDKRRKKNREKKNNETGR